MPEKSDLPIPSILSEETIAEASRQMRRLKKPRGEAQRLLLPELKDPFFCYFLIDPVYSEIFGEGCGMGRLMPHNHERRERARAAKKSERKS